MPVLHTEQAVFELEVPIVIAGAGACGLVAALSAHDAGVDAVALERSSRPVGSSGMSLGALCAAGTAEQRRYGIDDNADRFFADIMAKTGGTADRDLAATVAEAAGPTLDWLASRHDVSFALDPKWPPAFGHSAARMHVTPGGSGADMMSRLVAAAERVGTEILCDAQLTDIFTDDDRVTGVRYRRPNGHSEDIGCRALVLATCGFAGNRKMVAENIPSMADARYFGWEGNDGSGLLLGAGLGGELADMDAYQGLGLLADPLGIDLNPRFLIEGGIQVNSCGERFSNEVDDVSGQGARVIAQPGGTAWVVYDYRIHASCFDLPQYRVLREHNGVVTGASASELASRVGIPADRFEMTLASIPPASPDQWGREFSTPALSAPYYAVRVTGAIFHTQGGLVVGMDGRVRRPNGTLLPNLHAGGGAARGISGRGPSGYLPGAGLCAAITLGALCGRGAVASIQRLS